MFDIEVQITTDQNPSWRQHISRKEGKNVETLYSFLFLCCWITLPTAHLILLQVLITLRGKPNTSSSPPGLHRSADAFSCHLEQNLPQQPVSSADSAYHSSLLTFMLTYWRPTTEWRGLSIIFEQLICLSSPGWQLITSSLTLSFSVPTVSFTCNFNLSFITLAY